MSMLGNCQMCSKVAKYRCHCSNSNPVFCKTHYNEHTSMSVGRHLKESILVDVSSEDITHLYEEASIQSRYLISKAIEQRNQTIKQCLEEMKEAELNSARVIEEILNRQRSILTVAREMRRMNKASLVSRNQLMSSIASMKQEGRYVKQNIRYIVKSHFPNEKLFDSKSEDIQRKNRKRPNYELFKSIEAHSDEINSIDISPCQSFVATASDDKTIKLWALETGNLIYTITEHKNMITTVRFLNNWLVSGGTDTTIKIWDKSKCKATLKGHLTRVNTVSISSSKELMASGSHSELIIWNTKSFKSIQNLKLDFSLSAIHFSIDDKKIIFEDNLSTLKIYEINSETIIGSIRHNHFEGICCIKPHGNQIISSSSDNTVKIWNINSGKMIAHLAGHSAAVVSIDQSGNLLASLSQDDSIKIWDLDSNEIIQSLKGHGYIYTRNNDWKYMRLKFSSKGDFLVSGGTDHRLNIWKLS